MPDYISIFGIVLSLQIMTGSVLWPRVRSSSLYLSHRRHSDVQVELKQFPPAPAGHL